jgi:hypothetical protein
MTTNGYIKASGDNDYNFGTNDFTVEFFVESLNIDITPQTLFEIANINNSIGSVRFFTAIEAGNINTYCIQLSQIFTLPANTNSFSLSLLPNQIKIYYNGKLLGSNEYTFENNTVIINNPSSTTALVEIGTIIFSILGAYFTPNITHFVSVERKNNLFYLYLDGISQHKATTANVSIPNQSSNLAVLTIGANTTGNNPLVGTFGDFRITNGFARHVDISQLQNTIYSQFTDTTLGTNPADIIIDGGPYVDNMTSYSPEECIPGQIFDTISINVYQNSNCSNLSEDLSNSSAITTNIVNPYFNRNNTIIGFRLFKNTISIGAIGTYSLNSSNSANTFSVPWTTVKPDAACVLINNNPIASNQWHIFKNKLILNNNIENANINIIQTGNTEYYSLSKEGISYLTSNLHLSDSAIMVANVSGFTTPNVAANKRGTIFINNEKITYLYINRTDNVLSGLMRGVDGTGVPNIHMANSQVISASSPQIIPGLTHTNTWYNMANSNLAATNSEISTFLINQETLPPA